MMIGFNVSECIDTNVNHSHTTTVCNLEISVPNLKSLMSCLTCCTKSNISNFT
uniref:Uncharacterized protein n=1 Tax=Rhizophora mucronata TaxID=61149 RepID=A0A2P2NMR8_RHIMU